jgi:hypothetical protein
VTTLWGAPAAQHLAPEAPNLLEQVLPAEDVLAVALEAVLPALALVKREGVGEGTALGPLDVVGHVPADVDVVGIREPVLQRVVTQFP